jgi:hypothetical protein
MSKGRWEGNTVAKWKQKAEQIMWESQKQQLKNNASTDYSTNLTAPNKSSVQL